MPDDAASGRVQPNRIPSDRSYVRGPRPILMRVLHSLAPRRRLAKRLERRRAAAARAADLIGVIRVKRETIDYIAAARQYRISTETHGRKARAQRRRSRRIAAGEGAARKAAKDVLLPRCPSLSPKRPERMREDEREWKKR